MKKGLCVAFSLIGILALLAAVITFFNLEAVEVERTKLVYKDGFELIMRNVQSDPFTAKTVDETLLSFLKKFWTKKVKWVEIKDEKVVYDFDDDKDTDLEKNKKECLWVAVIPPGHKFIKEQGSIAEINRRAKKINLLTIKPLERGISKEWAGIVMVREIAFSKDIVLGNIPYRPSEEEYFKSRLNAYQLQIAAINSFTGGKLEQAIENIVDGMLISPIELLSNYQNGHLEAMEEIAAQLDPVITNSPALSDEERKYRDITYLTAICLSMADKGNGFKKEYIFSRIIVLAEGVIRGIDISLPNQRLTI